MLAFVLRRLLVAVPLLLLVSLVTFAAMRGMGGSPFELESGGVPAALQYRFEQYYALDRPWIFEWANYLRHIVTLDFGPSLTNRYLTVDQVMEDALPRTGQLALLAACWAVPIGIALGLVAAVRRQTWVDAVATGAATLLMVAPVFLFASLLSSYAVGEWGLVPGGWDTWQAKVLPSLVLGLAPAGMIARLIRAAAVETLEQDYVRTARAKGLTQWRILIAHVLRNSVVPCLSAAAPMLALILSGAFFVEAAFGIAGAANQFLSAAKLRDYPIVMGLTIALALVVIMVNLVADVIAAWIDPRLRERRS